MTDLIELKFETTSVYTRWPCHVCGGCTEKVSVLVEGEDEHGTVRVCERCLEEGDIDERLERTARHHETQAELTRKLIGRLKVPTYEEWKAADRRADTAVFAANFADDDTLAERVMTDDATYAEWRKRADEYFRPTVAGGDSEIPF